MPETLPERSGSYGHHEPAPAAPRTTYVRWRLTARIRHFLLLLLVVVQTSIASSYMLAILPYHGGTYLELAILFIFALLFGWISIGFWNASMGFFVMLKARSRYAITNITGGPIDEASLAPTAILMPIYHEDIDRVTAGLKTTYRSLEEAGYLPHFEFFILSDTRDPDQWVEEELAWAELCRALDGFGRIHYRRRQSNIKRKSGNIADFCRRWGSKFRYMVILDADSVMTGSALARLVSMMERYPAAGIIQTTPQTANKSSLYARVQQFGNRVYGPMYAAGLHFWQLGSGYYWGHNAIIRIAPFIRHCGLSRLSDSSHPLGGEILSHDFVEAALMRRAGWEIWLAYDLPGSFEETPPTLLDELKRDQRWSQGNLQHLRLLLAQGLNPAHRAMFFNGVMAYSSALLWLLLLVLSTVEVTLQAWWPPSYFPAGPSQFPVWPEWRPDMAIALLASTGTLLFLPKFLSVGLILLQKGQQRYGGTVRLLIGTCLEIGVSMLLAPVRMLFHSKFVFLTLLGWRVRWSGQVREDAETGWLEAIRQHGVGTLIGIGWTVGILWLEPSFFWWLMPILVALVAAIPVSVILSRAALGRRLRRWRVFLIPEEVELPRELRRMNEDLSERRAGRTAWPLPARTGFIRAAVDPYANAVHLALLRSRGDSPPGRSRRLAKMCERALSAGPGMLGDDEKSALLHDIQSMHELHFKVWALADQAQADQWGLTDSAAIFPVGDARAEQGPLN